MTTAAFYAPAAAPRAFRFAAEAVFAGPRRKAERIFCELRALAAVLNSHRDNHDQVFVNVTQQPRDRFALLGGRYIEVRVTVTSDDPDIADRLVVEMLADYPIALDRR